MFADQMREHFGVGAGLELVPGLEQALLELIVVLDDAVVNDGDLAGLVEVRMGVFVGRRAVGGPARVGDADLRRRPVRPAARGRCLRRSCPASCARADRRRCSTATPALS